jgi:predicted nucleic acid-binding protein
LTTVVSDTSPINYLIRIGAIEVLPNLFDKILIPPAVLSELRHPSTPRAVYNWADALPPWARIQAPSHIDREIGLGRGETEAISLALELKIPAILIDEKQGRLAAKTRGLTTLGTLNILNSADLRGLLDFEESVMKLRQTNFRVDSEMIEAFIREVRTRKGT